MTASYSPAVNALWRPGMIGGDASSCEAAKARRGTWCRTRSKFRIHVIFDARRTGPAGSTGLASRSY